MKPSTYTPNVANSATAHQHGSSTGVANTATLTTGGNTSAIYLTVETTAARVTFDGTDPQSGSGLIVPAAALPVMFPVGGGTVVKWCAAAVGASALQMLELT